MNTKTAINELSQSEKIKAGLIWASHTLEHLSALPEIQKSGATEAVKIMIHMIGHEAHLARKTSGDTGWMDSEKHIDMALVMIDSGVPHEAAFHLTRALSQVTGRAQRAMSYLVDQGLM
jgi:hypothetical protein